MNQILSYRPALDESRGFYDVDGVRLEYRWLGPKAEEAPTLVFLHEGLGAADLWRDLPDRVAAATGWGALVYSRHGYGRSDPKPAPWPRSYLHDEAIAVLPRLLEVAGVSRPVLVGHSDGGSIAAIAAGAGLDVAGLVLMAPHVMVEPATIAGVRGALDAYEGGRLRGHLERYHGANVEHAFWGWCRAWLSFGDQGWDARSLLAGITAPVLVMQGDDDEYGSAAQYQAIEGGVSGPVSVRVLPSCRHLMYRDQPGAVVDGIVGFVAGLGLWPDGA